MGSELNLETRLIIGANPILVELMPLFIHRPLDLNRDYVLDRETTAPLVHLHWIAAIGIADIRGLLSEGQFRFNANLKPKKFDDSNVTWMYEKVREWLSMQLNRFLRERLGVESGVEMSDESTGHGSVTFKISGLNTVEQILFAYALQDHAPNAGFF